MLKKTAFIIAILVVVGFVAVSVSSAAENMFKWPDFIKIATPRVGTGNHSVASAWSAEFSAATKVKARVMPAPNGYARSEWLTTDQVRISLFQASDYIEQLDGIAGYASKTAGPADSRSIYISLVTPWGFMVRGDSKIKSYKDIGPGTKVVWYAGSSFLMTGIRALLAMNGLTTKDVKLIEVGSYGANSKVVAEGRGDVTFTSPLSDLNYEVAANPKGVRWLEIPSEKEDPKAHRAYKALQAGYSIVPVKSGHKSAHGIRMAQAYQNYHVRGDEDPELVYQLVKWLDENHASYKSKYTHAKLMSLDSFVEFMENDPVEPVHPGMIRYLTEKGLWKDSYARRNEFNLKLANKYIAAYEAAVKAAVKKGLKIDPKNEKWVKFWQQAKKDNGIAESFGTVKRP
jgi:uncharacterized protein